jgi:multidrug efflux system outer membrane protein
MNGYREKFSRGQSRFMKTPCRVVSGVPSRWAWPCAAAALALTSGCSPLSTQPGYTHRDALVARQWHAALPAGDATDDLRLWWTQFDDPVLVSLVEASQRVSSTIAQAGARIEDARAQSIGHGAALLPRLDINASSGRGRIEVEEPTGTATAVGLMASWELDLFGGNRAGLQASWARLASFEADWSAARIAVAAEVGTYYSRLRACEARLEQVKHDAQSRVHTAYLTAGVSRAGLATLMASHQANASAAQGEILQVQQQERCDLWIKTLVSLSGLEEGSLRRSLQFGTGMLPRPAAIQVSAVPAQALAQRPDIRAAELDVIAASADIVQADSHRLPRISLNGNIGLQQVGMGGVRTDGRVWQVGPVVITMPLFDGGRGRANAEAARVRFLAAKTTYAAMMREAIREIEAALVELHGASKRKVSAQTAVNGFDQAYRSWQSKYQAGMASLLELEDARRSKVAVQQALIDAQEQQVLAWISLYRALGGGWNTVGVPRGFAYMDASVGTAK